MARSTSIDLGAGAERLDIAITGSACRTEDAQMLVSLLLRCMKTGDEKARSQLIGLLEKMEGYQPRAKPCGCGHAD